MPRATRSEPGRTPNHDRRQNRTHLAGYIAWLPRMNTPGIDITLEGGCYQHPVVILSPLIKDDRVVILTLTSFGETDISAKHRNPEDRRGYLPIAPSNRHPDNQILLHLKNSSPRLRKKSYINTKKQRLITFNSLHTYSSRGEEYVLSQQSYQTLIDYAKFAPSPADVHQATLISTINTSRYDPHNTDLGTRDAVSRYLPNIHHLNNQIQPTDLASSSSRTHTRRIEATYAIGTNRGVRINRFSNTLLGWSQQHLSLPQRLLEDRPVQPQASHNYGTINYSSPSSPSARNNLSSLGCISWETLPSGAAYIKVLQILFWLTIAIVVGYYVYCGGCWIIWAVGAGIDWIKDTFNAITMAVEQTLATAVGAFGKRVLVPIEAIEKGYGVVAETAKNVYVALKEWISGLLP